MKLMEYIISSYIITVEGEYPTYGRRMRTQVFIFEAKWQPLKRAATLTDKNFLLSDPRNLSFS